MRKFVVHFCVSCYLDCIYWLFRVFVISALDHLGKRTFTENFHNLISISNMLPNLHFEITFKVVEDRIALELTIASVL